MSATLKERMVVGKSITGGIIATLGASDFKHSKMILVCVNKNDNEDYYGVHIRQKKK